MAQISAEGSQAKARGEIFDRLLRGFPANAVSIRATRWSLSKADLNRMLVHATFEYKKPFQRALRETLAAIAVLVCKPRPRNSIYDSSGYPWTVSRCLDREYRYNEAPSETACVLDDKIAACFVLIAGNYCGACTIAVPMDFWNCGSLR